MMKRMVLVVSLCAAVGVQVGQALAQDYPGYPAPTPGYPFQRSFLTGRAVLIPPYRHPFPVRVYTTPPTQPYYNVPPYAVVAPY